MRRRRRGISIGTVFMLIVTLVVTVGMVYVLGALRNQSATLDPGRVLQAMTLGDDFTLTVDEIPSAQTAAAQATPALLATAAPAILQPVSTTAPQQPVNVTLTFGGTVAVTGDIRKSCYYSASKKYDFTELLDLVSGELRSDMTLVTLENLVDASLSMGDLITPAALLTGLRENGIDAISLGFAKCLDKDTSPLLTTLKNAADNSLRTTGAYASAADRSPAAQFISINGINIALLTYTDNLTAAGKKALNRAGAEWLVPTADEAEADIRAARQLGADVVIVCVSWGKSGTATVSKAQKTLAQQLADAGADVILGCGTRTVQTAEWLTRADGGQALCCYSLGSLLTASRSNSGVAGMLLHLTLTMDTARRVTISGTTYTPTYIWHYKQDGVYHFRVVNAASSGPDGMDSTQLKAMKSVRTRVQSALGKGSPLTEE